MQAINAMKQALEFVKANHSGGPDAFELIETLDQAIKQEALQAMHDNAQELGLGYEPATVQPLAILNHAHGVYAFRSVNLQGLPDGEYQVYTTAPAVNKPWVGLTDDEVKYFQMVKNVYPGITKEIEAKLKALNYPTGNYPIVDN